MYTASQWTTGQARHVPLVYERNSFNHQQAYLEKDYGKVAGLHWARIARSGLGNAQIADIQWHLQLDRLDVRKRVMKHERDWLEAFANAIRHLVTGSEIFRPHKFMRLYTINPRA